MAGQAPLFETIEFRKLYHNSRGKTCARRADLGSTRLTGLRVGAFWDPDFPALISFPGPAWRRHFKPFPGLSSKTRQIWIRTIVPVRLPTIPVRHLVLISLNVRDGCDAFGESRIRRSCRLWGAEWRGPSAWQPRLGRPPVPSGANLALRVTGGLAQAPAAQSPSGFASPLVSFWSAALCLTNSRRSIVSRLFSHRPRRGLKLQAFRGFIKLQRNTAIVAFVSSFVRLEQEGDDGQTTVLGHPGLAPSARVAPALRRGQSRPRP